MNIQLKPISIQARCAVIDIFNYYVENSLAAYPEKKVPYEFFDLLLKASQGYPTVLAEAEAGKVLGFGLLRAYHPLPAFARSAEISYFIRPEYTHQGIGVQMLDYLLEAARQQGLRVILASISAFNQASLQFHLKNDFVECGRFQRIGQKNGQIFDVVWMQKSLAE